MIKDVQENKYLSIGVPLFSVAFICFIWGTNGPQEIIENVTGNSNYKTGLQFLFSDTWFEQGELHNQSIGAIILISIMDFFKGFSWFLLALNTIPLIMEIKELIKIDRE
ncbi:hypothetical protein [Bacillus sp. BB56-3]|uniref:hypothetical protein n=1 Tax=Bacillus sp. BB56-3 TaxID=2217831 RepID=UPI0011EF28FA|nr:hypothetical protein [Bacillus sp. BB56-3]KAA0781947.1 hypothetical protein DN406_30090 [Bacillus sp. BB56-3]